MHVQPPRRKKIGGGLNLQEKVVSAPQGRECTPRQSKSPIFEEIGEIWAVGEVFRQFSVCFESDD